MEDGGVATPGLPDINVPDKQPDKLQPLDVVESIDQIISDPKQVDLSNLSADERHRIEHQHFHKKHKGHEAMHAEMVIILIATLIIGQALLVQWRLKSPKTYNSATLLLLWIVPLCFSIYYSWYRFLSVWSVFTLIVSLVLRKACWKQQISPDTPRFVYRVFLFMFRVSLTIGTVGYVSFLLTMLGINLMFMISPETAFDFSFLCLFYGFYFGVVIRDISDMCSTSIAKKVGYYKEDGCGNKEKLLHRNLAPNICAICGNAMFSGLFSEEKTSEEKTVKLSCEHTFHEYCIRGWVMVGKKNTCPYCSEKVDVRGLMNHPWEKYNLMYAQLLEWIRYLVAWQPVIVTLVHFLTGFLGLE